MVRIPNTSIDVSKYIFGTASLFNCGGPRARQALLSAAVEAGFRHFDTAPYYGFGVAERDLAPILKAHPHVTVTTKVGIYSPGGEEQPAPKVFLRKVAGRFIPMFSRPTIDFALKRAKLSLEDSLRRLNREVIDIYCLHEPELAAVTADEWLRWLEDAVTAGKVHTFGLALSADRLEPFLAVGSELAGFVQVCDSLSGREADILTRYRRPLQVTYGYVSAARAEGSSLEATETLERALQRNREGAIIVSTRKIRRLSEYARLACEVF